MPRGGRGRRHHGRYGGGGYVGMQLHVPTIPLPFYMNNSITYCGPGVGFIMHFNNMSPDEKLGVKVANIQLYGDVVQEFSTCCLISTMILGGFFIFPYCLLCCDCYKRSVYEQRILNNSVYQAVASAIRTFPNLENLVLFVADSTLNASKASVIQNAVLAVPKLTSFSFKNLSGAYDNQGREYSDFQTYFQLIKQANRFMYVLNWGTKNITIPGIPTGALGAAVAPMNMEMTQYPLNQGIQNPYAPNNNVVPSPYNY